MLLLSTALAAGMLLADLFIEVFAVRRLSASVYTAFEQPKHAILNTVFAIFGPGVALSGLLVLLLDRRRWRSRAFVLTLVGWLCWAAVSVISVTVNVPINFETFAWSIESPPENWAVIRDRWQTAHVFRPVLAVLSLTFQIFAVLSLVPSEETDRTTATAHIAREVGQWAT